NWPAAGSNCKRGQRRRAAISHPPPFRGRGELCPCALGGRSPLRPYCALRPVSGRERKTRRALGRLDAHTSARKAEKRKWTVLGSEVGPQDQLRTEERQMADWGAKRSAGRAHSRR